MTSEAWTPDPALRLIFLNTQVMAWGAAKRALAVKKLKARYLDDLQVDHIELQAFGYSPDVLVDPFLDYSGNCMAYVIN